MSSADALLQPGETPIRLLLVDDHGLFREGLSRLLADDPLVDLVLQCASVEEAAQVLASPQAATLDLLLLDFDLGGQTADRPSQTAFDVLRSVASSQFRGRVLLVTAGMAPADTARAIAEGAAGVFLKHWPPAELLKAIGELSRGRVWPGFDARAAATANQPWPGPAALARANAEKRPNLTERERAVLRGVFQGLANKEIAAGLHVSEGSVKAVLQQLFAKTGVRTRAQLVRIALERRFEYGLDF